jgi:hypothetical protein
VTASAALTADDVRRALDAFAVVRREMLAGSRGTATD